MGAILCGLLLEALHEVTHSLVAGRFPSLRRSVDAVAMTEQEGRKTMSHIVKRIFGRSALSSSFLHSSTTWLGLSRIPASVQKT